MRGAFRRWQAETEFSQTGFQRAVTILSFSTGNSVWTTSLPQTYQRGYSLQLRRIET